MLLLAFHVYWAKEKEITYIIIGKYILYAWFCYLIAHRGVQLLLTFRLGLYSILILIFNSQRFINLYSSDFAFKIDYLKTLWIVFIMLILNY
jgi:hypothetical protein